SSTSGAPQKIDSPGLFWNRRARTIIAAVAALALLTVVAIYSLQKSRAPASPAGKIDSLAVLPLVNASGDSGKDYLADGITESLIKSLSQLPDMKVISRDSVFRFKGQQTDAQTIARQLGVQSVVIGNVRQV